MPVGEDSFNATLTCGRDARSAGITPETIAASPIRPMANAMVSLMQSIGHDDFGALGDSTGELSLTYPKGTSAAEAGV